jgi:MFS family permease
VLTLVGWLGGLFGVVTDKIGRTKAMSLTIIIYSVSPACADCPDLVAVAAAFHRGAPHGGEWGAGASIIAEVFHAPRMGRRHPPVGIGKSASCWRFCLNAQAARRNGAPDPSSALFPPWSPCWCA